MFLPEAQDVPKANMQSPPKVDLGSGFAGAMSAPPQPFPKQTTRKLQGPPPLRRRVPVCFVLHLSVKFYVILLTQQDPASSSSSSSLYVLIHYGVGRARLCSALEFPFSVL